MCNSKYWGVGQNVGSSLRNFLTFLSEVAMVVITLVHGWWCCFLMDAIVSRNVYAVIVLSTDGEYVALISCSPSKVFDKAQKTTHKGWVVSFICSAASEARRWILSFLGTLNSFCAAWCGFSSVWPLAVHTCTDCTVCVSSFVCVLPVDVVAVVE